MDNPFSMLDVPKGGYQVIYADPPWQFSNKKTGGSMKSGASTQYSTMTIDDLKALPVAEITAPNAILVMWWVGSMPQEAIDLVHAWGFKLKNMNGFVWNKLSANLFPFFGMGFYTRAGSESAIIAVKGKFKPKSRRVRAVVTEPVGRHSEKPNVFRHNIVELAGDVPRLELFARESFDGWAAWGNEVDKHKHE